MSSTEFTADLRDIRFVLHEQLGAVDRLAATAAHGELDRDTTDALIDEGYRIATEVLGPASRAGDRQGCTFHGEGHVTVPDAFRGAWDVLAEGGWLGLTADPEVGGMGMPHTLGVVMGDLHIGANVAFALYPGLSRAASNLLATFAPPALRALVCAKLNAGAWSGTMCLTEAGAGSDVGANRASATPQDDGSWLLSGEKIFISCGDHDLVENIVHLVLARAPDAPAGTRGLSIFLVPKFLFAADGTLGARNGVMVGGIEEKMGIHGSATCTLVLGADAPCRGWLLGEVHQGMRIMFHMMNEARIEVAIQGMAGAAAAYQAARSYAGERVQGTDIRRYGDPDAPAVTIDHHPDVRRMLMWQKVHVQTMRSAIYEAVLRWDLALALDGDAADGHRGHVELMTPILKATCSDRGYDCTVIALQVFGGAGYTAEYPVEQIVRDTKIASIYEGTNGIQAMDLLGRKMRQDGGGLYLRWLAEASAELERCQAHDALAEPVVAMTKARDALVASAMHIGGLGDPGVAMLQASPFLDQFGCTVLGLHALWQARVALERLASDPAGEDAAFYRGKILNAGFYCAQVLPRAVALGRSIRSEDTSCLQADALG